MDVTAYVPCYNNAQTLAQTLDSVRRLNPAVAEILAVDDGSRDNSVQVAAAQGVQVLVHSQNLGRGAARAKAMEQARYELVLCCDATNVLSADFLEKALPWFENPQVAAVFGYLVQPPARTVVERWRGRHLFRLEQPRGPVDRHALLATYGAVVRKSAVLAVGNYDPTLRHSEDRELGERLLQAGYEVIHDPKLEVSSIAHNTLAQVLERYWRWYCGKDETVSWSGYLKQVAYATKVMALQDLRAGDPQSIPISLFSPHYQFWRSWWRSFLRPTPMKPPC
ncbi:glycosyltransferase [Anthocerotibacter panamensis]|uniref:glycosyltransferase n=1 Tax=Anthocerotibacter panamensis TaxID=2857077 RepID=UPI001C404660|nr:glycosyltransferase family 2 protein [Anthocerotibacter panamensis]